MKADRKDKLKAILKLAADKQPAAGFTASVMNTIEADLQREAALKVMLQKHEAVGPSFSFTANVMAGIKAAQPKFVYKPIISRRAWYGIAAALMAVLVLAGLTGPAQPGAVHGSRLTALINYTSAIPPACLMAMAVIVLLLTADYLFNRYKNKAADHVA